MKCGRSTLIWKDYTSWESAILEMLSPYVNEDVIKSFRINPPEYIVSDDTSCLDSIIHSVTGVDVDIKGELATLLVEKFDFIRAFHGCCPLDIDSYYKQGIRVLDTSEYNHIAKDHFLSGKFPELSESNLVAAIAEMSSNNRGGRVFFEANANMHLKDCGHYMLYGSEYLVGIAAKLSNRTRLDYRKTLLGRGTPTVFTCDVPFDLIDFNIKLELAGNLVEVLFEKLLDPNFKHPQRGFGFSIKKDLPPQYIVGHVHPINIHDPIR
jgi:hypothetical protein